MTNQTQAEAPEISDEFLLERIQARDVGALDKLYERHSQRAFALAYRMVSSREVAEEVLQDAFMSVWRQAATYRPTAGIVRPWLLSIVRHRAIDRLRRTRDRQAVTSLDEAWMTAAPDDVFRDVYRGIQRQQVRDAIRQLPDEQRLAVEMAYFNGNTFAEIAEMTGVPVGTVKSRVRLALGKLKTLLDAEVVT